MQDTTRDQAVWWILRIAAAMCFIGHGMFGIITKAEWLPFFALVGIGPDWAYRLMPLIGTLDIALGISVLFRPMRAALLYMAVWSIWTAALRPMTGDSVFELLERAGNYGVPIAFLTLVGAGSWFTRLQPVTLTAEREARVWRVLSWTTAFLLVGHAGLAISAKPLLVSHAGLLGMDAGAAMAMGGFELALAAMVLVTRYPVALLGVVVWKMGTEMLFPLSGAPVWEWVERGGSYGAPLAMAAIALAGPMTRRLTAPSLGGLRPAALVAGLLLGLPALAEAQRREDNTPIAPAGIIDSMRAGGYAIVCRHAKTNHDASDRGPAREQQRNLDSQGEADAKTIGAAIRALAIPIGDVLTNPMYRNYETGLYAFGRAEIDSALGGRGSSDRLRELLKQPVERGTNRAIVTRVGIIMGAMNDHGVHRIDEGDCFVTRPTGTDYVVLGRMRVQDWPR